MVRTDAPEGRERLGGIWLLLSLQWRSNAITSRNVIAMKLTTTAAIVLPTLGSAFALRMLPLLSRGFSCVVHPTVLAEDAAPGEEENYNNERAVVVVLFDMRGVGAPMSSAYS